MKLWDKGIKVDKKIEEFTVGLDRELDINLARWDVLGSLAHIQMLNSIGLLSDKEFQDLSRELKAILVNEIKSGQFQIEEGVEDIHSQIEGMLTERLGESGKKIHSGRSRNDQVLVDLRLYFRHEIKEMVSLCSMLFDSLLSLSEAHKEVLMPGYTHMQIAMPSSFGLWFGGYAESIAEDMHLLLAAWRISNHNPLGSAAGYGSSFPLDRKMTTELLGFEDLTYNSISAQMGRGKTEKTLAFAMAGIAATIGKFAADICLYNGQNFNFFKLPKELTTGSSIMPHKTNPDVFEIMRGRCNRIQSLPSTLTLLLSNLSSGYHRDLQLTKEELMPRIEELKSCLEMCIYAIDKIEVNQELFDNPIYDNLFTVEAVNKEVLAGTPFREAYKKVAALIERGEFVADKSLNHQHEGSIGNLSLPAIKGKMAKVLNEFTFEKVDLALLDLQKGT